MKNEFTEVQVEKATNDLFDSLLDVINEANEIKESFQDHPVGKAEANRIELEIASAKKAMRDGDIPFMLVYCDKLFKINNSFSLSN